MKSSVTARMARIERTYNLQIPPEVQAFLTGFAHFDEAVYRIEFGEKEAEIRTTYRLDEGPGYPQLDGLLKRVGKALPRHTLPIASDWGGNFFLYVTEGENKARIVFWDHERRPGDDTVQPTGLSLRQFLAGLEKVED